MDSNSHPTIISSDAKQTSQPPEQPVSAENQASHKKKKLLIIFALLVICIILLASSLYLLSIRKISVSHIATTTTDFGKTLNIHKGDTVSLNLNLDNYLTETLVIKNPTIVEQKIPLTFDPQHNTFKAGLI